MLMAVFTVTLCLQLFMAFVALDELRRSFHGRFGNFMAALMTISALALVSLFLQRALIDRRINSKGIPSPFLQYLSALIETSLPTIAMIVGAQFIGPIYTLFTPAGFVYALFIVLSILRLNAGLCVFTGAVAGAEYTMLAML